MMNKLEVRGEDFPAKKNISSPPLYKNLETSEKKNKLFKLKVYYKDCPGKKTSNHFL